MKTFRLKKEDVNQKWYLIDASEKIVGRFAGQIAKMLMGKDKPEFTPGVDSGDYVVIINCEKVRMTGKKADAKIYRHHSFYPGGLKEITYERMMNTHPERILYRAVKGMLPKNKLQSQMLKRLRIFKGEEHPHAAQNPEILKMA